MALRFLGMTFGERPKPVYEAAALPESGDVVISCNEMLSDERISATKARAIYNAVKRYDTLQAMEARQGGPPPSIIKTGEQTGEQGAVSGVLQANPA
jgi:hypothetical protein